MKIELFESYRGDKIIKLYNGSILDNYYKDKEEYERKINDFKKILDNSKSEIIKLINEYVNLNRDYFKTKYYFHHEVKSFNYYIDEDTKTPKFSIDGNYSDRVWLKYDDIEGLLNFINNPDLYRDIKKYNL